MSAFHIYCEDEAFPAESVRALEKVLAGFAVSDTPLAIEFLFVSADEIKRLNGETRGVDKVTDVLSYPTMEDIKGKEIKGAEHPFDVDEEGNLLIGSVAVCLERARAQAEEYGHSFERELTYLLVHGVMHCFGYDHMTDSEKAEMREKEEDVLGKLGITRE